MRLQRVTAAFEREVDATLQIVLESEVIETTAEHPFYTQEGWKDAADLTTADCIKTKNQQWQRIKGHNFLYQTKKVYNFEVENWHTYFVGMLGVLVHNAQKCVNKYIKGLVGNRPLRELTHNELYNAFKKLGIDMSGHAIKRLKDIRTKHMGFNTPNDIIKIFNNGTKTITNRAIEISYKGLKVVVSKESRRIITITP